MRLVVIDGSKEIYVALSKRNLLALVSKLDHPDSACRLVKDEPEGWCLIVTAESNEDHYTNRLEGPAGLMVDFTEQDIVRLEGEGVQ